MDLVCIIMYCQDSYIKRSKRVNEQIICLCTSSEKKQFTCEISDSYIGAMVSEIRFFKRR